jgi:hypothetical protein
MWRKGQEKVSFSMPINIFNSIYGNMMKASMNMDRNLIKKPFKGF